MWSALEATKRAHTVSPAHSRFIATALFATFSSSFPILLYIMLFGIIGIVATTFLTDYTNKNISVEYHEV